MIFSPKTGSFAPHPPSRDSNEDKEIDFDDLRDYMDQDSPAGQQDFHTAESGPISQFLTKIPDWMIMIMKLVSVWMNMTLEDLNLVLDSLPIPLDRPIPPRISIQGAIQVNQGHDTNTRQNQDILLISYMYTIP